MRILISIVLLLITTSSFATTFEGKFIQGSFILGKTEPGSEVFIDKKKVKVTPDGYFAFGLGRDRKNDVVITIDKKKIVCAGHSIGGLVAFYTSCIDKRINFLIMSGSFCKYIKGKINVIEKVGLAEIIPGYLNYFDFNIFLILFSFDLKFSPATLLFKEKKFFVLIFFL